MGFPFTLFFWSKKKRGDMKRIRVFGGALLTCLMYAGSAHAVLITSAGSTTVQQP